MARIDFENGEVLQPEDVNEIGKEINGHTGQIAETKRKIGELGDLITDDKSSLVAAINEAVTTGGGGGGGGGGATTAAKVSFNKTGTSIQSSNVQGALVEIDGNMADIMAEVFPLKAEYVSHNAGVYEQHTPITPCARYAITRKGADVSGAAVVEVHPKPNFERYFPGWEGPEISTGSVTYETIVRQGGQFVHLPDLTWSFTNYRYRGELSAIPTDYAEAIRSLSTKELTTSPALGATRLGAGKYYLFAVKGTSGGGPLPLVVRHAQTGGVISGCVLGQEEIEEEHDDRYSHDYTYILIPASAEAWDFTISLN